MKTPKPELAANGTRKLGQVADWLLAAVVFMALALRATAIETPVQGRLDPALPTTPEALSLALTTTLLLVLLAWLVIRIFRPQPDRIRAGFALAAGAFTGLSFAAVLVAADKRAALSDAATLSVPLLLAAAFVDLFRDDAKRRLFLWLLAALGAMTVYQEYEQYSQDNEMVIRSYEENPEQYLEQVGIRPGTLQHWQFEHRIRSRDIRGFLRTSNSTASFLLLACFGALGLTAQRWKTRREPGSKIMLTLYALLAAGLLGGILLGRSRGAIAACAAALVGLALCLAFGGWFWRRRRLLLIAAGLGFLLLAGLVTAYGLKHGRLPGPNALLVRWQYWHATAQMIADHLPLGVGGGNFADWYTRYKIPAAPETVRDPHNFILAVLAQYGVLGLAALLAAFALPLGKLLRRPTPPTRALSPGNSIRPGFSILILTLPVLLALRLVFSEGRINEPDPTARLAYYIIAYVVPAAVFTIVFAVLLLAVRRTKAVPLPPAPLALGLTWGLVAVLIHNLIDFAIFETPVWLAFWLTFAALLSLTLEPSPAKPASAPLRFGLTAALFVLAALYLAVVFLPPWTAGRLIRRSLHDPAGALAYLTRAAEADPLAHEPLHYSGQAAVDRFRYRPALGRDVLHSAVEDFKQADRRNPAAFKIPKSIMETNLLLAETADTPPENERYRREAYEVGKEAHRRYPGSDDMAFTLGRLAEQLGRPDEALAWYRLAVDIETAYRAQFAEMYPAHDLFSRLGDDRFEYARGYLLDHAPGEDKKKAGEQ